MLDVLNAIAGQTDVRNVFMGGVVSAAPVGGELAGLSPAQTEFARLTRLAVDNQGLGNEQAAIDYFQQAFDLASRSNRAIPVLVEFELVFRMAVSYMRLAETQNCVQHQGSDSCILPIRGNGIHGMQEGSRNAIKMLTIVLNAAQVGTPRYLEAR